MSIDAKVRHSRRRLLAAAAGGAAALAAGTLTRPSNVAAVATPVNIDTDNPSTALTSITQGTLDTDAFKATAAGIGTGVEGASTGGAGVLGVVGPDGLPGVVGLQGDTTDSVWEVAHFIDPGAPVITAGSYGFSNLPNSEGIGVLGETGTGIGVVASGFDTNSIGLLSLGNLGAFIEGGDGAFIVSDNNGTGIHAHVGTGSGAPVPTANTAIYASVTSNTQVGLEAHGRVRFPNRSGRVSIGAGRSVVTASVSGMTSSNFAIATLNSNRSGRYVRAVVCSAGRITIYLNTAVTSATYVAWLVLG
jgi:hypothetical protein